MDKKAGPTHKLPTRDPPQNKRPTQLKVKGWKQIYKQTDRKKKSRGSNTHIRQNRLKKNGQKRDPGGHFTIY